MFKIILTSSVLVTLIGCVSLPSTEENNKTQINNQTIRENTANMSDFDRQKYYTDNNLGPVPVKPVNKPRRD